MAVPATKFVAVSKEDGGKGKLGTIAHVCSPSVQEAEARELFETSS